MPIFARAIMWFTIFGIVAFSQTPDVANIEIHGDSALLSVNTHRPLEAVAAALESRFNISATSEDPIFSYLGDMVDISPAIPKLRPGTFVPAQWGFEIHFPVNRDGSPRDVHELIASIVHEANVKSPFGYRADEVDGTFFFVPTRSRDAQGRSIAMTPLLDREVTIPLGFRPVHESAGLMAADLSRQTGLHVSCCQSSMNGIPWGLEQTTFSAQDEPARSVLWRLGIHHWHVRCDREFCFIDMR